MASKAHCIYCFEVLSAKLENRSASSLSEVSSLWDKYTGQTELNQPESLDIPAQEPQTNDEEPAPHHDLRPRQFSRLQDPSSSSSSSASTPINGSSSDVSKTSSKSSLSLPTREEEYPLFVTWNKISRNGHKNLRGCIGTFEAQPLSQGLKEYALISALNDHRFSPIAPSELPTLSCSITLLQNFTPCSHALDWELGTHGIKISFSSHGRRYSSTYLPQVAPEQGWDREETVISLMRKAGWNGRTADWQKVEGLKVVRYEGKIADLDYGEWMDWSEWIGQQSS